jgi:nucleotide-binding universal stress UspA family protein
MKILLATDGSEFSTAAIRECCDLFNDKAELELKFVSVFEEAYAIAAEPFAVSAELYREISEAAERQAEHYCSAAAEMVRGNCPEWRPKISHQVIKGNPEQEVVEIAKEWGADLIVVGSHGRGFWGRLVGSVSDAVVHHAPCSVLVVRNAAVG